MERFFSDQWSRVQHLRPQVRSQVRMERQREGGRAVYVLSDPLGGRAHRVSMAGAHFLRGMDGERTVDDIWEEVVERLGRDAPSQDDVIRLLSQLHQADLLSADLPPDLAELSERRARQARALFTQNMVGPMSLRLPLFDPDPLFARTLPLVRPLVSRFGLLLWLALVIYAAAGALAERERIVAAFSDMVWSASSIALVAGVYVVVKCLHELGHGWVSKRFGAPVHEIGIMFLVFMPVPYVDASEAGALPGRWRRAAVAGAGIIVETGLAAIAFLFWRDMEPGLARAALFNIMLIAGVSTVLVNGNPLLRFDGYFVFSDLIGIPNLAQRANRWWAEVTQRRVFGAETVRIHPANGFERTVFALYAPAAFVYRVFIALVIAGFVASQFFILGVLIAAWSLTMGVGRPVAKALWTLLTAPKLQAVRGRAVAITAGVVGLPLAALFVVPAPHTTVTMGVVWMPAEASVRAEVPGRIEAVTAVSGRAVRVGDPLLRLNDPLGAARLEALRWRVEETGRAHAAARVEDQARARLAKVEVEEAERALARERERQAARTLLARADGRFAPVMPTADLVGRWVSAGEGVGHVLPGTPEVVRVVVGQDAIDAISGGVRGVALLFPGLSGRWFDSRIVGPVPGGAFRLPSPALGLDAGGPIPTDPRDPDGLRALERVFRFDVALPPEAAEVRFGTRVHVRLSHPASPLGPRLLDRVTRAFLGGFDV